MNLLHLNTKKIKKQTQVNVSDSDWRKGEVNDLFEAAKAGKLDLISEYLEDHHISSNIQDYVEWSLAHWAAQHGQIKILQYLKDIDTNFYIPDEKGDTLLHKAASGNQYQTLEWLINNGFNVQISNNAGILPVQISEENELLHKNNKIATKCVRLLKSIGDTTF